MPLDVVLVAEVEERPLQGSGGAMDAYFLKAMRHLPAQPPVPHAPQLSVVALGTYLRKHGFDARVFDNVFHLEAARESFLEALDLQPLVVGISTTLLFEESSVRRLVDWIRQRCPNALIVLGGASAERRAEIRDLADVTVFGMGEKTLVEVVHAVKTGGSLESVPNLALRRGCEWARTLRSADIGIGELPPVDWSLLRSSPLACYSLQASRGCRYNCSFCSYVDIRNQRMRPIPDVIHEMRRNQDLYGISLFRFVDSNLTSWPEQAEALCQAIIDSGVESEWGCYARVDNIAARPKLADKMRRAGCRWVFFGIESCSDQILRNMRKGYNAVVIRQGVARAREAGLHVHGNFMVGFPGETRWTVEETLNAVAEIEINTLALCTLVIDEGSEADIALRRERYGLEGRWMDWKHSTMDSVEAAALTRMFIDRVALGMERTLVANWDKNMYQLGGAGFSVEDTIVFMRAFRDFYRADRDADESRKREALARIADFCSRLCRSSNASEALHPV